MKKLMGLVAATCLVTIAVWQGSCYAGIFDSLVSSVRTTVQETSGGYWKSSGSRSTTSSTSTATSTTPVTVNAATQTTVIDDANKQEDPQGGDAETQQKQQAIRESLGLNDENDPDGKIFESYITNAYLLSNDREETSGGIDKKKIDNWVNKTDKEDIVTLCNAVSKFDTNGDGIKGATKNADNTVTIAPGSEADTLNKACETVNQKIGESKGDTNKTDYLGAMLSSGDSDKIKAGTTLLGLAKNSSNYDDCWDCLESNGYDVSAMATGNAEDQTKLANLMSGVSDLGGSEGFKQLQDTYIANGIQLIDIMNSNPADFKSICSEINKMGGVDNFCDALSSVNVNSTPGVTLSGTVSSSFLKDSSVTLKFCTTINGLEGATGTEKVAKFKECVKTIENSSLCNKDGNNLVGMVQNDASGFLDVVSRAQNSTQFNSVCSQVISSNDTSKSEQYRTKLGSFITAYDGQLNANNSANSQTNGYKNSGNYSGTYSNYASSGVTRSVDSSATVTTAQNDQAEPKNKIDNSDLTDPSKQNDQPDLKDPVDQTDPADQTDDQVLKDPVDQKDHNDRVDSESPSNFHTTRHNADESDHHVASDSALTDKEAIGKHKEITDYEYIRY